MQLRKHEIDVDRELLTRLFGYQISVEDAFGLDFSPIQRQGSVTIECAKPRYRVWLLRCGFDLKRPIMVGKGPTDNKIKFWQLRVGRRHVPPTMD